MKTAVFVSGSGTNLQALIDADLTPATLALVVSNKADALALERASKAGIETLFVDPKKHTDRKAYDQALLDVLKKRDIDFVVLAGFMRILGEEFISSFPNKIINTHPALLPSFPGLHGARQAIGYGAKVSGCTLHFVDAGIDTGPVIFQTAVPVLEDDTEETLQKRIQAEEHRLLPKALKLFAEGKIECKGRKVLVRQ